MIGFESLCFVVKIRIPDAQHWPEAAGVVIRISGSAEPEPKEICSAPRHWLKMKISFGILYS